jgi:carbon-monoxide dehydrogenase medium subunit
MIPALRGAGLAFIDARDLTEALDVLGKYGADATVLAGGTDVMVQYLRGDIRPTLLLHVRNVPELKGLSVVNPTVIGAATTHWQIVVNTGMRQAHAALAEAADTVGGRQTQNVGTIAGNVVNASPAADLLPALLIGDAKVTLASGSTTREIPLADFVVGRRSTLREPDELVVKLSLERAGVRTGETYLKVGRRGAMEVAIVGLAARVAFDEDGTVTDARIAVCSVAPTAFRVRDTERRLLGSKLDQETLREAGELLRRAAKPIDDARADAAYRTRVLAPLLERAARVCRERAGF